MGNQYDDIINLPPPVSYRDRPMSMRDRAAQFSPFAALTGHQQALAEVTRQHQETMADADRADDMFYADVEQDYL